MITEFISSSTNFTRKLGAKLALQIQSPQIFILSGEMGTGKTEFVRGFVEGASGDADLVRSPTFTLWLTYDTTKFSIHHLDLYRISSSEEIYELGFFEMLNQPNNIFFIEWGEKIQNEIQENINIIEFEHISLSKRKIIFHNLTEKIKL